MCAQCFVQATPMVLGGMTLLRRRALMGRLTSLRDRLRPTTAVEETDGRDGSVGVVGRAGDSSGRAAELTSASG